MEMPCFKDPRYVLMTLSVPVIVIYGSLQQYTFAEVHIPNIFKITDLKIDSIFNIPILKAVS